MSIENAILELAAAIKHSGEIGAAASDRLTAAYTAATDAYTAYTAAMGAYTAPRETAPAEVVATTTPAPAKPDGQTPAQKAVADAKAAAAAAKEKKAAEEKAAAEAAPAAASLDYDKDIAPALTSFAKTKGKDALIALLAKFGAKKGSEIKADDYAAVLAEITEADLV